MTDRLGRVEFFATLPAGFLILLTIVLAGAPVSSLASDLSTWAVIKPMAIEVEDHPALILLLLFGTYLCGSLVRSIPVWVLEHVVPPFRIAFPHTEVLRSAIAELTTHSHAAAFDPAVAPPIGEKLPITVFNHWKNFLCSTNAEAFRYYQSFESRSRMFAGMTMAGFVGLAGAIVVVVRAGAVPRLAIEMLVASLLTVALFGGQFNRVRKQEVGALLSMFIWARSNARLPARTEAGSVQAGRTGDGPLQAQAPDASEAERRMDGDS